MQKLPSALRLIALPGLVVLVATLVVLTFPNYPQIITEALSEKAVLSHAHERGWHFGTDLVFTYGPLGFLSSRYFFAHAAGLRFATDLLFCLGVCLGVTRLAWRLKPCWRCLLIGTFIFLTANIDPRYDLLLYLGAFSWSALCFLDSGSPFAVDCACLSALLAFGVLVKANFLFLAGLSLGAITSDLLLQRKFGAGLGLIAASVACFFGGWFAADQSWTNVVPFFSHIPALASGYNSVVGLDGLQVLRSRGLLAVCLLALAATLRCIVTQPALDVGENADTPGQLRLALRRFVLAVWLVGLVFLIWKHGFVRGDMFHMGFFFGFAPFCAVALEAFSAKRSPCFHISRISAMACWLVVIFTLQLWCLPALPSSLIQPWACLSADGNILLHPREFEKRCLESQQAEFSKLDLPKVREIAGTNTLDVFGQDQLYALYNRLNYCPRPVFQSYMAYNSSLNHLNEHFYLSSSAPEYVLFRLTPIDHKFPPLEDAWVLRDLLFNYSLADEDGPYLLLKQNRYAPPRLTLLQEMTVRVGERIDLTSFGQTNLWMEIQAWPSLTGRIRSALYKPSVIRLIAWAGKSKTPYKAPAPMLAAGFMANPLLLDDDDVREFYRAGKVKRPDAYSVTLDSGGESFWQPTCQCRIYSVQSAGGAP